MPHRQHDAMLGPGGRIIVPESEGEVLVESVQKLMRVAGERGVNEWAHKELWSVIHDLKRLLEQVKQGYHRNPFHKGQFQAGTVIGKIGTDVHDIRYTHSSDGKSYEHHFGGEAEVWAVQRNNKRELLISHVRGLPLWEEFN
jgi:hypothetical protein